MKQKLKIATALLSLGLGSLLATNANAFSIDFYDNSYPYYDYYYPYYHYDNPYYYYPTRPRVVEKVGPTPVYKEKLVTHGNTTYYYGPNGGYVGKSIKNGKITYFYNSIGQMVRKVIHS